MFSSGSPYLVYSEECCNERDILAQKQFSPEEAKQVAETGNDIASFGALLKAFRKHRRLTQQQLAESLGMHRSAIVRWEQGDFLPQSKALVLEVIKCLHLDEQESRHLLEVSLIALPPYWYVPLPRNPFFTGREEILEALHTQLGIKQAVALTQSSALHGLGGAGKTQIALEYAYRHALEYSAVFWIASETEESIVFSLLRIAEVLQLPEREEQEQQRVVTAVQRWLTTHSRWLLIWDNVEDLTLLARFLPSARSGAVLITTRDQVLGTFARGVDLLPMKQEEGMLFLLRRAKVLPPEATYEQMCQLARQAPGQYAAATELVTALGSLPLALDQAGAYIEETHCDLPAYLELFRSRRPVLLQQRGVGARDHPAPVSTTFALAIAATTQRHPAVGDLLQICALLQSDAIPEELFRQGGEHLGVRLEATCRDALEWNQMIAIACSYSLLSRQPEEQTLSIHRLVQAVLQDTMTEEKRKQWTRQVIAALDAVFPEVPAAAAYSAWKQGERLVPHALLCLHRARATNDSLTVASLAYKVAQYLRERGRYAEAEPLYQRALHIQEQVLGSDHPDVAASLNYLAVLYRSQGRYAAADALFQRTLCIREQVLGSDHPLVTSSLNSLANLYTDLGKYAEAKSLYLRALRIRERVLGSDHPKVAQVLDNLALLYWRQGKYTEAEPLYQRALHIQEQIPGSDHPNLARTLNNLAILYRSQGRYPEAERLYQRALHIQERVLGSDHPLMASLLGNLAECYQDQSRYREAEKLYQRALHVGEQALGSEHPLVAELLNGLAILYRDQDRDTEAESLYQRALSIREQCLGKDHPETAETLHEFAMLRHKQGHLSQAFSLAKQAFSIRSQSLGDAHPKTIATKTLYAELLEQQVHAQEEAASTQRCFGEIPDLCREEREVKTASPFVLKASHSSLVENDPMQDFLDACCELHPLAWCRIRDLRQTYEQWTASCQGRIPLSRRAFVVQMKARGCRVDRTSTARIWRGIRLRDKNLWRS
jgi:tetratricopeptide (TPR) repeat protein